MSHLIYMWPPSYLLFALLYWQCTNMYCKSIGAENKIRKLYTRYYNIYLITNYIPLYISLPCTNNDNTYSSIRSSSYIFQCTSTSQFTCASILCYIQTLLHDFMWHKYVYTKNMCNRTNSHICEQEGLLNIRNTC